MTLIDNGEGEGYICPDDGKFGFWYALTDDTGGGSYGPLPFEMQENAGTWSARMWGSGFGEWVLMGVLVCGCDTATPYDASAFTGLEIQLTGITGVSSSDPTNPGDWLTVVVWTTDTASVNQGGTCTAPSGSGQQCNGHFRKDIFIPQDSTGYPLWVLGELRWDDTSFAQPAWAVPATFDPAHILRIEFRIDFPRGTPGANFDINVANLAFSTS